MIRSICVFTGHRRIAEKGAIGSCLDMIIEELIAAGITIYVSGMALGFDALASMAVLKAREKRPKVRLISLLPCINQDEHWKAADKEIYRQL